MKRNGTLGFALVAWIARASLPLLFGCAGGPRPGAFGGPDDPASSTTDASGSAGGSDATSAPDTGAVPSGGSSSGGRTLSSSGSSGGMPTGSAGPKDATAIVEADVGQTVTLNADAFNVPPGAEVYNCQRFANPFSGEADLVWMQGKMSQGSHHFFLFSLDPITGLLYSASLSPCPLGGLEIHPFPFLSQQPLWTTQYPPDSEGNPMGYPLPVSNYLMINVHYLNAASAAVHASVSITIEAARPGVVKTHVGNLFLNNTSMSVPASATVQSPSTSTGSWSGNPSAASADGSYSIFTSWSHMHKWALGFSASTGSNAFYTETNWNEPALFWHMDGYANATTATGASAPIKMSASQGISWSCKYYNDTGGTLTFGESAQSNVMCIYVGQYFPASPASPDVIFNY